jgi:hypothetical protein
MKFQNQYRRRRNPITSGTGPLSNEQKAALCILAREAWEIQGGEAECGPLLDWRRGAQFDAVGKSSLTECAQSDYLRLRAHFLSLKGESGRAMSAHVQHQTEPERVAMFKLEEACAKKRLPLSYAESIGRQRFKTDLDKLSAKQIWWLVFTMNNRPGPNPVSAKARPVSTFVDPSNCPF